MNNMTWMRTDIHIVTNPKLLAVARMVNEPFGNVLALWQILCGYASSRDDRDGDVTDCDYRDYEFLHHVAPGTYEKIYEAFVTKNMIYDGVIVNFNEWQEKGAKSDKERAKAYRDRKKAKLAALNDRHDSSRDESDASQRHDQEQNRTDIVCIKNNNESNSYPHPPDEKILPNQLSLLGNSVFTNQNSRYAWKLKDDEAEQLIDEVKGFNNTERPDLQVADEIAFAWMNGTYKHCEDVTELINKVRSIKKKWGVPKGFYPTEQTDAVEND